MEPLRWDTQGCEACRRAVFYSHEGTSQLVRIGEAQGGIFLARCAQCGAYWEQNWHDSHVITSSEARRIFPEANVTTAVTTDILQAFADAWNRHDVDAIMAFMTDDCVFESSAGPDICGTRYAGRDAVRAGFAEVWAVFPDANWGNARHFVQGDRGVSEWTFTGTRADGSRVEVHGCDLFTFRDDRIVLKNSYRKNRPPLLAPSRETDQGRR